jgi:Carboxypeptidase regulatory-like domain/TonB dependent receptor/TonB-dependent Receptor Plug Domain
MLKDIFTLHCRVPLPASVRRLYRVADLIGIAIGAGSILMAQQATLSGRISDGSHLVISGATVTLTSQETHLTRATQSNDSGLYSLSGLPSGVYDVSTQATGFDSQDRKGVPLEVAQQAQMDFTLEVGKTSQSVTVGSGPDLLKTSDASVSTLVDRQLTDNMPLNGRSFQNLVTLAPGVNLANAQNSSGQFVVSGLRATANSFSIDGVNAVSTVTGYQSAGGNNAGYNVAGGTNSMVSVDALREFRVLTSSYAAEYGRNPGAHVLLITRSGTNSFHGALFDYFRNDKLDAADWFVDQAGQSKPRLRSNDFGGVFGGPIVFSRMPMPINKTPKNKTFFFVSFEGQRLLQPQFVVTAVPSVLARQSAPAVAQPFLDAFPVPNGPQLGNNQAQFSGGYSNPLSTDSTLIKVDRIFSARLIAFGTFSYAQSGKTSRSNSGSASPADSEVVHLSERSLTAGLTYIFNTALTTDFRINFGDNTNTSQFTMDTFGGAVVPANNLLLPGTSPAGNYSFVTLGDSGGDLFGGSIGTSEERQINAVDGLNYVFGTHQFKFGVDYRALLPLITAGGDQYFQFSGVSGLVNNQLSAFHSTAPSRARTAMTSVSLYAQDTWRASSRLNVTYGLRWEFNSVPHSLDPNNGGILPLLGNYGAGNVTVGAPGTALWTAQYSSFAPRLGVAWQLRRQPGRETIFRAGGGLYFDTGIADASSQPWVSGYPAGQATVLLNSSLPVNPSQVALPPLNQTQPPPGNKFFMFPSDFQAPRVWEWNLTFQQALGRNQTLSVAWVGAAGRKLPYVTAYPLVTANIYSVVYTDNSGSSDYNSLQVQYERHISHGLAINASYTWSHSLDTNSSDTSVNVPAAFELPSLNRGDSDFDIRHSLHAGISYNIPAFRGAAWMKALTEGWGVDGIVTSQTALPVNITFTRDIGFGSYPFRPDLVSGILQWIDDPNVAAGKRLNPAAFVVPATPIQGDLGRNALRGFDLVQTDLSARRSFRIEKGLRLIFRADLFNALNHPNFASPVAIVGSGLFGISTGTTANSEVGGGAFGLNSIFNVGGPRAAQLSLRLEF